jgi:hypothetical protein
MGQSHRKVLPKNDIITRDIIITIKTVVKFSIFTIVIKVIINNISNE